MSKKESMLNSIREYARNIQYYGHELLEQVECVDDFSDAFHLEQMCETIGNWAEISRKICQELPDYLGDENEL